MIRTLQGKLSGEKWIIQLGRTEGDSVSFDRTGFRRSVVGE